eukprot:2155124-Pleurochrysis_carterae.AAC.1
MMGTYAGISACASASPKANVFMGRGRGRLSLVAMGVGNSYCGISVSGVVGGRAPKSYTFINVHRDRAWGVVARGWEIDGKVVHVHRDRARGVVARGWGVAEIVEQRGLERRSVPCVVRRPRIPRVCTLPLARSWIDSRRVAWVTVRGRRSVRVELDGHLVYGRRRLGRGRDARFLWVELGPFDRSWPVVPL